MSNNKTTNADGSGTFYDFITLCKEIEKEPSYNNKTTIVKTFIKNHDQLDLYLLCKLLCCKDDKRVYNMKEKQLCKVLARIWKSSHADMITDLSNGDFTETAKKFFEDSGTSAKRSTITLKEVDTWLEELTKITKEDEQVHHFSKFLPKCTSMDLKFICKLMAHDLKINIGSKFVLNALHPKAFDAYTHSHNLKKVIEKIQKQELDDIEAANNNDEDDEDESGKGKKKKPALKKGFSVGTSVMSPIKPMLAKPVEGAEECVKRCKNGMYVEIKYDGERVQLHKNGDELAFYSRNLKPVKEDKVEEVREAITKAVKADSIILDGEILLMDLVKHVPLPFGTIGKNKKKKFANAGICFFAFDILYLNGESLIETPLDKRKQLLSENVTVIQDHFELGEYIEATKAEEVDKMMRRVMDDGLEGLVIKDIKGIYKPNMRHWLKLKKDYLEGGAMADSVDLVVVGLYYGKGNKAGLLSTFLMATFDEGSGQWKTVCKAGSGFDLKTLKDIQNKFDLEKVERQADKVPYWLDCNSTLAPDYVVKDPLKSFVFEIRGTSFSRSTKHTANSVSIRFPRIVKIRDDKDPENATNLKEFALIVSKSVLVDSDPKEEDEQGEEVEEEEEDDDEDDAKEKKKVVAKPKVAAPQAPKNQPKITAFAKTSNNTIASATKKDTNNNNNANKISNNNNINNDSDEEMADQSASIKVEGDVTRPQVHQANEARAILHLVDTSGKWPHRGVFGAISRAYPEPEKAYTSASTLKLGSIVTSKVSNSQDEGKLFVLSLICQTQTKNGIPPFDFKAFEQCLIGVKSLADYKKITSVHIPKFDAATPNMDWKQVERKINSVLTSHGIAAYVYEFGSKSPVKTVGNNNNAPAKKVTGVKRPLETDHDDEPPQKKAKINTPQSQATKPKKKELFTGVHVMFYGSCDNDKDLLSGAVVADGGDVMSENDDFTVATHLVTDDAWDGMVDACLATNPRLKVVHSQWLLDSIENGQLQEVKTYFVQKPKK